MKIKQSPITAIILTGGASRRMGVPKWSLPWLAPELLRERFPHEGVYASSHHLDFRWTLLDQILFNLNENLHEFVIVCAKDQYDEISRHLVFVETLCRELLGKRNISLVSDDQPYQGPLHGLCRGMETADSSEWFFVCGCDSPFINSDILLMLTGFINQPETNETIHGIFPFDEQFCYGLCGLYHISSLATIKQKIAKGEHRLLKLIEVLKHKRVNTEEFRKIDPNLCFLVNLNTKENYENLFNQAVKDAKIQAASD